MSEKKAAAPRNFQCPLFDPEHMPQLLTTKDAIRENELQAA